MSNYQILRRGAKGADVKTMQSLLLSHGMKLPKFGMDGDFGAETEAAVKAFQASKKISVSGIVDALTWAALLAKPAISAIATVNLDPRILEMEKLIAGWVGMPYVIGGQGHAATEPYIRGRAKAKPSYFTGGRLNWLLEYTREAAARGEKLICLDCSGLIWLAENKMGIVKADDTTAHRLYTDHCKPITRSEVRPGDLLFRADGATKVHVAFVGTKGTYEAVGTAYGVQFDADIFGRSRLNKMTGKMVQQKQWTDYGRLKWWE